MSYVLYLLHIKIELNRILGKKMVYFSFTKRRLNQSKQNGIGCSVPLSIPNATSESSKQNIHNYPKIAYWNLDSDI